MYPILTEFSTWIILLFQIRMVLPHEDQFPVTQPNLNCPQSEQSDIVSRLCALAWKERRDFSKYKRAVDTLRERERQAEDHNQSLQEEIITVRNLP